ncbi:MAG: MFS transporter, partial [Candidatus Dormibacteria bacterium]
AERMSPAQVGLLLTAIATGMAVMSALVGTFADRIGRRAVYGALFMGLALSGGGLALTTNFGALCLIALTGTLSTSVRESGPFTSLDQAMLPAGLHGRARTHVFGIYNAVAALAGAAGALAAAGLALLRYVWPVVPIDHRLFLVFIPVGVAGAVTALTLSTRVERLPTLEQRLAPLQRSRSQVLRLAGLFAVDSFAGGFVIDTFIAYWLQRRFALSLDALGTIFFAAGLLQPAPRSGTARADEAAGSYPGAYADPPGSVRRRRQGRLARSKR